MDVNKSRQLKCDDFRCYKPATVHRVQTKGWTLTGENYCPEHAGGRFGRLVQIFSLGAVAILGVMLVLFLNERGEPGMDVAFAIVVAGTLAFMLWSFFPEAKVFGWRRRLAAVRLLRHGEWAEIHHSAPALIFPLVRRILPEVHKRFRKECQDAESKQSFWNAVALLDQVAPGWTADEVDVLTERLVEKLGKPGCDFLEVLALLDRDGLNWPGLAGGALNRVIKALVTSLSPYGTDRSSPDQFTIKNRGRHGKEDGSIAEARATPELDDVERAPLRELKARLNLLIRLLRQKDVQLEEAALREAASCPDLGIEGAVGVYLYTYYVDEWDDDGYDRGHFESKCRQQTGVKKIISCAAVRELAARRRGSRF